jgi:uncharacterized membrane protein (UPF0127 family)
MGKFLSLTLLFITLMACQSESERTTWPKEVELTTPAGEAIKTTLAVTMAEQERGLSGVLSSDFNDDQGMLFFYLADEEKHFWMPDTYFDLDIIFLDKDLKVLDVIRKLPHYKGRANPELIPRARGVWARHALEMKASSSIADKIKVGDQLKWKAPLTITELEQQIQSPAKN